MVGLQSGNLQGSEMTDAWLPSLKTDPPKAGFQLAVKLSRMEVKLTQPN